MKKPGKIIKFTLKFSGITLVSLAICLVIFDQIWFSADHFPPPHFKLKKLFHPGSGNDTYHALLISGGISPNHNHARYWNNTSLMYNTLKMIGFRNITVLHSDGLSPGKDRVIRSFMGYVGMGKYRDSPRDLDQDGTPDIDGPATVEALKKTSGLLGKRIQRKDILLIFITDHGRRIWHRGTFRGAVKMWNNETLFGSELETMITRSIHPDTWVIIMATQCHGNKFLSEIHRKNTVLINGGSFLGFMWSTQHYGVFTRNFCSAFLQKNIKTGEDIRSDLNEDGRITLHEAFSWARQNDPQPVPPRIRVSGKIPEISLLSDLQHNESE